MIEKAVISLKMLQNDDENYSTKDTNLKKIAQCDESNVDVDVDISSNSKKHYTLKSKLQ